MPRLQWIGQSARGRSINAINTTLLNGYAEVVESKQGKTPVALYGAPGLKRFLTLPGSGQVRSLYTASNGRCFAVQGNQFYELASGGTATLRGTLQTLAQPVVMRDNGLQLAIVDNPNGYSFVFSTNGFTQIADATFTGKGAMDVEFLDNRLYFIEPSSQEFFYTDLLAMTFDPLFVDSAIGAPDGLVAILVQRREAWLFGTTRTEVWVTTTDPDSPVVRLESGFVQMGCAARHSPARVGETILWLGRDEQGQGVVVQAQGFQPQSVTSHEVATALQGYSIIDDAVGWAHQQHNHSFYWLTFPSANATWVYDVTAGLWAERAYLNPMTGARERHRANCYTFAFNKHLVGDKEDGRIYELDMQTYSDDGDAMVFEATLPTVFDGQGLGHIRHDRLQIDAETGVGLDGTAGPGTDPPCLLLLSDDGGHVWEEVEPQSLGPIGETRTTLEWYSLGASYSRDYQIRITAPVKRAILGAYVDTQVMG